MAKRRALRIKPGYAWCSDCGAHREMLDDVCLTCDRHYAYGLYLVPAHLQPYLPGGV